MTWLAAQLDVKRGRLELGSIHRAQPYSHHFARNPDEIVSDENPGPDPKSIVACERNSQRLSSFTVDTSVCASITYPTCSRYGPWR